MEQNKDIDQGLYNVPDNPYTQSYQEYIAKPVADKDKTGPKHIISMILCGVSSAFIAFFALIFFLVIVGGGTAGRPDDVRFTVFFLSIMSLGPAIAAKVLNRKSIWAVINIICICVLFIALIVMYVSGM